jgi:hypothetical protein
VSNSRPSDPGTVPPRAPGYNKESLMRRVVIASTILLIGVGAVTADTFRAVITKVDGNNVTFAKTMKKGEKGEEMTLSAQGAKVFKGKFDKETKKVSAGDPLEGGLSNEVFFKSKKGVFVTITTEGDKITEIIVAGGKKGKKKKDNN